MFVGLIAALAVAVVVLWFVDDSWANRIAWTVFAVVFLVRMIKNRGPVR